MKQSRTKKPVGRQAGAKKAATKRSRANVSDKTTPARKKPRRAVSEAELYGGLYALAGYVNQMLGSAADFAWCLSGKAADSGGFKTLLCFETEVHGQDQSAIGLTREQHRIRVLKQYKYSSNPEQYKIRPSELQDIADTLKKSAANANREESLSTTLVLCTNRPITARARGTPAYGSIRHEQYEASKATRELESYAVRFGVFNPDELYQGVQRATYYLFQLATSPSNRLTRSVFEENLIGHKQPRSIALPEAVLERRQELHRLGTESLRIAPASLADRETLKSITLDWTNDAIIVLVGDGGYGKTTALWQLLWEAIKTVPPQRLADMMISQGQTSESFGAVVERWRGVVSASGSASDDLALERVKHANPDVAPPIVLFGLDGIDETHLSPMWSATVARVLRFFWGLHVRAKTNGIAPPARLLVSCRDAAEVERLLPNPTGVGETQAAPRYVRLAEFDDGELTALVEQSTVDQRATDRILRLLLANFEVAEMDSGPRALSIPSLSSSRSNLDLLRHPILWRSFCLLDAHAQSGVLDGSTEAQDQLGAAFLEWFCDRVHHRLNIETNYVPHALRSLAQTCSDSAGTYPLNKWVQCVHDAAGFTENEAKSLYHEGVSSGLVQDIPPAGGHGANYRSWRWKHAFLSTYLQRSAGK